MEGASEIVVLSIALIFIALFTVIIRNMMKASKEERIENRKILDDERKQNKELLDKLLQINQEQTRVQTDRVLQLADDITNSLKIMNEKQDKLTIAFNSTLEGLFNVIDLHTDRTLKQINEDKFLNLTDFDKIVKIIMENSVHKIRESIEEKIEKNNLVENKEMITGGTSGFKNSEVYSVINIHVNEGRDKIRNLKFKDNELVIRLFKQTDLLVESSTQEICYMFDVQEGYVKANLFRQIKNIAQKMIYQINKIRLQDI